MAEGDFDINTTAAEFLSLQLGNFVEAAKGTTQTVSQRFSLTWGKGLRTYIESLAGKSIKSRSFFHRLEPVPLYDFYVPVGLEAKTLSIPRVNSYALFAHTSHAVVQGSGGCGKSVLIKHLLIDILKHKERLPVFIELRELNRNPVSLDELIASNLTVNGLPLTTGNLSHFLEKGLFCFLFDGFDELSKELRAKISKAIQDLSRLHSNNRIIVTSRPDDEFAAWAQFTIFSVTPLTLDQATDLVGKTPISPEIKQRFNEDLKRELYEKHKSFLSNPLLLSIMLLTYHDAANIPKKLSVFYSKAYDALFQKHDALKGGFSRPRLCELDIHDFARIFSAFSILAFDRGILSFTRSEAIALLKEAKPLTNISYDESNYLEDAIQGVCLLVEDGLQISYSHRSFQEYFAARFIADAPPALKEPLLKRATIPGGRDQVVNLLHEMQPDFVETKFLLPCLTRLFKFIGMQTRVPSRASHHKYLSTQYSFLLFDAGIHRLLCSYSKGGYGQAVAFAIYKCGYLIDLPERPFKGRYTDMEKMFTAKTGRKFPSGSINAGQMKIDDPVLETVYEAGGYFSKATLTHLWDISSKIRAKNRTAKQSIASLLQKKNPLR